MKTTFYAFTLFIFLCFACKKETPSQGGGGDNPKDTIQVVDTTDQNQEVDSITVYFQLGSPNSYPCQSYIFFFFWDSVGVLNELGFSPDSDDCDSKVLFYEEYSLDLVRLKFPVGEHSFTLKPKDCEQGWDVNKSKDFALSNDCNFMVLW